MIRERFYEFLDQAGEWVIVGSFILVPGIVVLILWAT